MKIKTPTSQLPTVVLSTLFAASVSQAAIVFTPSSAAGAAAYDSNIAPNLIRAGASTLDGSAIVSHTTWNSGTFPTTGVNDGSAAGNSNFSYWATKNPANGSGSANWLPVTITFNLTGSATGYDITSIQSIAGWNAAHLGSQSFQLLLSINNGAFADYGTYTNTTQTVGANASTLTSLTDSTGVIASGVTGIQFVFVNPDPGNAFQAGDGGTLVR